MNLAFKFVDYGTRLEPEPGAIVLDVGMKTVPGVIDHHHPGAEPECAASLVVKHPGLVLDHIRPGGAAPNAPLPNPLTFITHKLPDFDSLASIFLAVKLLETNRVDPSMMKIGAYAKLADSARLSKRIELSQTPYAVLRALFSGSKKSEEEINKDRIEEGLKFMRFLHAKAEEGRDIVENRTLFAGIDRYERAVRKIGEDYTHYLADLGRGQRLRLDLPTLDRTSRERVDGLAVSNPRSFLLKDWAWRDKENSPSGAGFGFLMMCFRSSRFILGVDPDRGVNLRGLGPLLDQKEGEKRKAGERAAGPPWYEGDCPFFDFRIVDSPQDGTSLGHNEVLEAVLAFGNGHILESTKERS